MERKAGLVHVLKHHKMHMHFVMMSMCLTAYFLNFYPSLILHRCKIDQN